MLTPSLTWRHQEHLEPRPCAGRLCRCPGTTRAQPATCCREPCLRGCRTERHAGGQDTASSEGPEDRGLAWTHSWTRARREEAGHRAAAFLRPGEKPPGQPSRSARPGPSLAESDLPLSSLSHLLWAFGHHLSDPARGCQETFYSAVTVTAHTPGGPLPRMAGQIPEGIAPFLPRRLLSPLPAVFLWGGQGSTLTTHPQGTEEPGAPRPLRLSQGLVRRST